MDNNKVIPKNKTMKMADNNWRDHVKADMQNRDRREKIRCVLMGRKRKMQDRIHHKTIFLGSNINRVMKIRARRSQPHRMYLF
jgi:hypothetical protein